MEPTDQNKNKAWKFLTGGSAAAFVVLLGVVSLLSDMTYEGGRSLVGQYLQLLGASAAMVGLIAGAGEFLGYALRLITGWIADRSGRYWMFTIIGYAVNLLAFPTLALVGRWELVVALMLTERVGKAIRSPSKDAMLSYAASRVGRGWGFGLHEAMDQIGAVVGPLLAAGVLASRVSGASAAVQDYQRSFGVLIFSALAALAVIITARFLFPKPRDLEDKTPTVSASGYPRSYWLYIAAIGMIALGFAEYPLLAYHFKAANIAPDGLIPVFYAVAMAVDAVSALLTGWLYDRLGSKVLLAVFGITAFFAPLAFFGGRDMALAGVILWGVGMGAAESILRVPIAEMVSTEKRASAYGTYHFGFGIGLFAGGAMIGWLYDQNMVTALVVFSVSVQLLSLPLLWYAGKQREGDN